MDGDLDIWTDRVGRYDTNVDSAIRQWHSHIDASLVEIADPAPLTDVSDQHFSSAYLLRQWHGELDTSWINNKLRRPNHGNNINTEFRLQSRLHPLRQTY